MGKKKKIKPPAPAKTRNFVATNVSGDAENVFDMPWEIRRRLSKKDRKTGKIVDTTKVIGKICFSEPDDYKCSNMTLDFEEALTKDEYFELINGVMSYADTEDRMTFARIEKSNVVCEQELMNALEQIGFGEDPLDSEFLMYEEPVTNWGPIYMCFGLSIGMAIGVANRHQGVGMCIGMAIGLMIGSGLASSAKATREKLKEARLAGTLPPDEDDE